MKATLQLFSFLLAIMFVTSCAENFDLPEEESNNFEIINKYLNVPEVPYNYTPQPPLHAGPFAHNPDDKFLHPKQIELRNYKARVGRVLFYDTRLSKNNTVSCASCHNPEKGFADDLVVSKGFDGELGTRNSLALGNTIGFQIAYGGEVEDSEPVAFSWDDTVEDMQSQIKAAITSPIEMGMTMDEVVQRMRQEELYQVLFEESTARKEINEEYVLEVMEAFVNSIIAGTSKFDKELDKGPAGNSPEDHLFQTHDPRRVFPGFTTQENAGKTLYNQDCASCHSNNHTGAVVAASNNGLDIRYADRGKGDKTFTVSDQGIFKVPFLKNIAISAPYMHDGRMSSLEEVIDHYSEGIKDHPNLGKQLRGAYGKAKKFNYTQEEKDALLAYLHTLTDLESMMQPMYSNPWKQ